ncbi:hypothetical protein EYS09_30235 [Streptomyces kasugaensis]|uniref:Uncharacterized protein n=1 Tax=Streptomyces kasugaensis TaxID=1946 RepID=A0A4Q9HNK9_STRKA|nr:hypothetical protein [Streptomyces kasugaensis]TBO55999.1 hypothetical protein EYS09_30235 [Streptomyces kasugaensis]
MKVSPRVRLGTRGRATVMVRESRWWRWVVAVLVAAAGAVLLGPGATGPGEAGGAGDSPADQALFTLRSHDPYVIEWANPTAVPRLTPAFENTGRGAADRGVVLRVTLTDARFDTAGGYRNCYYAENHRTVYCEFPDRVPVGAAFETAEPLPKVLAGYQELTGSYAYAVWPLGGAAPARTEDYRAHYRRGTDPALRLRPTVLGPHGDGGELRFRWAGYEGPADWSVTGVTIRGRIGEYAEVGVPRPRATPGPGPQRVRVEVPPGTTLAPLSRQEREGTPSEVTYCARDDQDGNIYCGDVNWSTLRVRIDRRVEGAEGRLSVPEPANGDTDAANNSAPIKVEITGAARPGHAVPPVSAAPSPSAESASSGDGAGDIALVAAVSAASVAALALVALLLARRGRARRAAPDVSRPRPESGPRWGRRSRR